MSKYLNVFNTLSEYQAFSASTEYVQPNVALVKETNVLYYDYGNNKPQVDQSDFKVESQEKSIGGDKYGKDAITKINYIPSGATNLNNAFNDFSSLKEVACELPSSVSSMTSTFYNCSSLVKAPEIPSSVSRMNATFYYCKSLVNAPVIPNSVTNMRNTFNGCISLVNAPEIPDSVEDITQTFYGCIKLKEVTFLQTTPPTYNMTLNSCPSLESIYVPDESVDTYKNATNWTELSGKIKPLSSKPTE